MMMAVLIDNAVSIHIHHENGNSATLCGLDGDDEDKSVNQRVINVPPGSKIDCCQCIAIFDKVRRYRESDLNRLPCR